MKRLIIVGAGGFGREVLQWARDTHRIPQVDWEIAGFLDKRADALTSFGISLPVLGDPQKYAPARNELFLCAVGDSKLRLELACGLEQRGARFFTLIHPTATVADDAVIGDGCIVCPGAVISTRVRVGRHVVVNFHATIGHDSVVGDGCMLSCHADVTGRVTLGQGVLMGSHASVIPGVDVGDFSVIGAGSVAFRDVEPGTTVIGVPARAFPGRDWESKD